MDWRDKTPFLENKNGVFYSRAIKSLKILEGRRFDMGVFQNGTFLNILGIALIALGTFSMFGGNRILSKERDTLLSNQIQGAIVNEADIQMVISNLTMPEKYFLRNIVKHPKDMTKEEIWRMLKSHIENIKPPFPPGLNPFQEILDSLVRKKIITYANTIATITPYGRVIVLTMIKNNVQPFDFDLDQ